MIDPLKWCKMFRYVGELEGISMAIRYVYPDSSFEKKYTVSGEWLWRLASDLDQTAKSFEDFLNDIRKETLDVEG